MVTMIRDSRSGPQRRCERILHGFSKSVRTTCFWPGRPIPLASGYERTLIEVTHHPNSSTHTKSKAINDVLMSRLLVGSVASFSSFRLEFEDTFVYGDWCRCDGGAACTVGQ